ncbi:flagellar hook-length control protein FliK [Marinospirillum sp. MEB164]|uniref:Flagellar hook-length control protein FliK n=1 Tax=Marinospirillum alkalitolerans TaxID=3123374 RepID=A0ABW8PTZ5_9GAMM
MMNASNAVHALLNFSSSATQKRASAVPSLEGEGPIFREQMQAATQSVQRRDPPPRAEKDTVQETPARQEPSSETAATSGQDLPAGGDVLPLSEETQALLSGLSEEQRDAVLEGLQAWLGSLSEQELADLQAQLEQGVDLSQLLSADLLAVVESLVDVDLDQQQILAGIEDLLNQMAAQQEGLLAFAQWQWNPSSQELQAATPSVASQLSDRTQSSLREALHAEAPERKAALNQATTSKAATQGDPGALPVRAEQFNLSKSLDQLVSSLNQQAVQPQSASKVEGLQQLLQSAGAGLSLAQPQMAAMMQGRVGMAPVSLAAQQAAAMANAEALANRISMMQSKNLQAAEMRLDPPGLGSIKISIRMQGDNASVFFQSANAHARDLIEQALPRLREMMEQGGLALTDAQVSQEDLAQRQAAPWERTTASGQSAEDEADADALAAQEITLLQQPLGLIDYYA